jgi:hypothetical protein
MAAHVPLKCTCGKVHGVALNITPKTGNRGVCYCEDCQAFAHYLQRSDMLLDEFGGTDICQLPPAQVKITEGSELLRCLRLSPKGIWRWYASCCNTPVGNTIPGVPFIGIPHSFFNLNDVERDQTLGPIRAKVHARFCPGKAPADVHPKAGLPMILRTVAFLLRARLAGRHKPSPFFDSSNGKSLTEPSVLTQTERDRLRVALTTAG